MNLSGGICECHSEAKETTTEQTSGQRIFWIQKEEDDRCTYCTRNTLESFMSIRCWCTLAQLGDSLNPVLILADDTEEALRIFQCVCLILNTLHNLFTCSVIEFLAIFAQNSERDLHPKFNVFGWISPSVGDWNETPKTDHSHYFILVNLTKLYMSVLNQFLKNKKKFRL